MLFFYTFYKFRPGNYDSFSRYILLLSSDENLNPGLISEFEKENSELIE